MGTQAVIAECIEQSAKGIAQTAIVIRGSTLCAMLSIGWAARSVFRIATLMNPMYLLKLQSDVKNFLARLKNPKAAGKYFPKLIGSRFGTSPLGLRPHTQGSRFKGYNCLKLHTILIKIRDTRFFHHPDEISATEISSRLNMLWTAVNMKCCD